jgi:hypothetical protein
LSLVDRIKQSISSLLCIAGQTVGCVRIESSERVKYILNAARGKFDYDLLSLLTVDDVEKRI